MRSSTTLAVLASTLAATPVLSRSITRQEQQPLQVSLPETTGPYKVGTVALPLTDYTHIDPLAGTPDAPSTTYRRVMVSFFYPAAIPEAGGHNHTLAPVFPPVSAALVDASIGAPPGTAASLVTRSYQGAPVLFPPKHDDFPVLLFGHGFGATRLAFAARMQELASRGWFVVNVDHTYDAQLVEFPSPAGSEQPPDVVPAYGTDPVEFVPIGGVEGLQKMRAADFKFVLDQLRANETVRAQIPGLVPSSSSPCKGSGSGSNKVGLDMDRVGAFGASLGGAGSAQAVSSYHADGIVCGANLDGAIWGDLTRDGLLAAEGGLAKDLSFMQLSSANVTRESRPSWGEFWDSMKAQGVGLQRQFGIKGAEHNSFVDVGVFFKLLGMELPVDVYGTIDPLRMLEVEIGYVDAFFGVCLKGKSVAELDGLRTKFPETFVGEE
ncbi:bacitracin transport system permease protein [Microdochium nivale]|nr:bacitracin transport system permease protein [Microdochium nivale]